MKYINKMIGAIMYEIRLTTIYNSTYDRDDIEKAIKLTCNNFLCPVNAIRKIIIKEVK